jgi:hypothetical protein
MCSDKEMTNNSLQTFFTAPFYSLPFPGLGQQLVQVDPFQQDFVKDCR